LATHGVIILQPVGFEMKSIPSTYYTHQSTPMKVQKSDILILLLWMGACIIFYNKLVHTDYFGYDEADHMFAVSKGLYANYMDENAISFFTFLKTGIEQGFQKHKRTTLSEFIRANEDITFYRHYHGPLYFYGLIISRYFVGDNEYSARWTSCLFLIVSIITVYIGCLSLLQENAKVASVIASVMLMCSPSNIMTAAQISAHGMYALISIITLFFMAKLLKTNDLRYWYYTIIAMAFSFLVIEYAPLLLVTFIVCVFIQRQKVFIGWSVQDYKRVFTTSVILFIGVIFIVWPGAWLKLSLVKNYIFFSYLVFIRAGEFGTKNFWEVWLQRLIDSPFEYILIIPAIFVASIRIKQYVWYLPFLLYSILMIIITFRNTSLSPTYISSLLPPLYILTGMIMAEYLKYSKELLKIGLSTIVVLICFTYLYFYFIPHQSKVQSDTPLKDLVSYLRLNHLDDKRIIIDRRLLPTLHYYFSVRHFPSFREEVDGILSIIQEIRGSKYDGVLYAGENHYGLEELLQQSVVFRIEDTAKNPSLNRGITYYKIVAVRPWLEER
jgi:hypothetical protein